MKFARFFTVSFGMGLLSCAGLINTATADTVLIDFGRTDNITTAVGWNNVNGVGTTLATPSVLLINSLGALTPYTLNTSFVSGGSFAASGADYVGATFPAAISGFPATALRDSMFIQDPAFVTFTFTGLSALETYDFLVYGARSGTSPAGPAFYTFFNAGAPATVTINNILDNSTEAPSVFGLTPNGSGEITMVFSTPAGAVRGALNVIQMTSTAIPEPGSLVMLGFGAVAMVVRRRKR